MVFWKRRHTQGPLKEEPPPARPRKTLLVGSVFAPSERNERWLDLQLDYLARSVTSFDHAVFLNRVDPGQFKHSILVGTSNQELKGGKYEHSRGLNRLVDFFLANPAYDHYLLLDSDAFPCKHNWLEELLTRMQPRGNECEKQFAAAVRTENLDTFPHPCAFFIKGQFLTKGRFDFTPRPYTNLAGLRFEPPGAGISTTQAGKHVFLPLLRTNSTNYHPVIAALYGGLFYHHGCGSRALTMRSVKLGCFDHMLSRESHEDVENRLFDRLMADRDGFLTALSRAA